MPVNPNPPLTRITVFSGSADGLASEYYQAANLMGQTLALKGISLVYGGGKTGLMGAVANGAIQQGGEVIGIIPEALNTSQLAHTGLSRLEVLPDMHQRQARMSQLGDAFIALPGGYGTLAELFEALTWAQIGIHKKPIGLLNTQGYFDPLLSLIEHAQSEGFIFYEHRNMLFESEDPQTLLAALEIYQPPVGRNRWVERNG